ncbi:glycine C-acetyltransferase [Criblamydia sequanensis]|uniref:2-amino-3-ketobutyrate coenzyme A ligase n=1 Tax=Candidatus Criblamydia sequanensis CRIB-18 TaxID=1437425 RepID=A0A090D3D4_9BACT|nr:glycine C-acetyltransferase [Criblamydia sequanensis]CDR35188.1 2-amino-3-ketobutyrate coenzyme A ligase [Criblamydia sequanensis CRIB-18]
MSNLFYEHLEKEINGLKSSGLYKEERVITSPQSGSIISQNKKVLNLCSNNYLGLADDKEVIDAAKEGLDHYGFGLSSVRFICGTQDVHKELEKDLSEFLKTEDTILYPSCFDANGGLFETLFGPEDAIISDELNHASIIDGIRLSKAARFRYKNNDMADLKEKLEEAKSSRFKVIATDGVFSMDGTIAKLNEIVPLARKYDALIMVDDCHAVGFMGEMGRGTHEYWNVMGEIDIITGTLGKALGGASGGYTSGKKPLVDWLRQRSRPYLFSNTLAPCIAKASLEVLNIVKNRPELRQKLWDNTRFFRESMNKLGFNIIQGNHPICPIMLGDATLAGNFAKRMLEEGVYVIGFSYPVVPQGKARIRTQMSAALDKSQLEKALAAFEKVGKELKII